MHLPNNKLTKCPKVMQRSTDEAAFGDLAPHEGGVVDSNQRLSAPTLGQSSGTIAGGSLVLPATRRSTQNHSFPTMIGQNKQCTRAKEKQHSNVWPHHHKQAALTTVISPTRSLHMGKWCRCTAMAIPTGICLPARLPGQPWAALNVQNMAIPWPVFGLIMWDPKGDHWCTELVLPNRATPRQKECGGQ